MDWYVPPLPMQPGASGIRAAYRIEQVAWSSGTCRPLPPLHVTPRSQRAPGRFALRAASGGLGIVPQRIPYSTVTEALSVCG